MKANMDAIQKRLSKMDAMEKRQEAMEKRLSKMNAMEERLETLERQACKDIFIVKNGKREIHSFLVNYQVFFSNFAGLQWKMMHVLNYRPQTKFGAR